MKKRFKKKENSDHSNIQPDIVLENDDVNLSELAETSVDTSFNDIINTSGKQESDGIELDNDVKIDSNLIQTSEQNENLPIFKEEIAQSDDGYTFKEGDKIVHKKYGRGVIIKTIPYEQRQFIRVEFENSEKKLLDPKVADIKLEQ